MNHKKLIIVAIRVWLIGTLTTMWWEMPLQSVSHPECEKWIHRDDMPEDCKLSLTEPDGQVNKESKSYGQLILSALRWTSYNTPHSINSWSHPSVDFVSAKWTPVSSIGDGTVVLAWDRVGYGKSVTIKHTLNGETIYSNYSHLDTIAVSIWKIIKQGEKVGTVWRTGFTIGPFGYHLDFQITTADSPSHPYWLHDCDVWYYQAVNEGACRDKIEKYTIDPIEFFVKHSSTDLRPLAHNGLIDTIDWVKPQTEQNNPPAILLVDEDTLPSLIEEPTSIVFNANRSIFASLAGSYRSWTLAGQTAATAEQEHATAQDEPVKVSSGLPYEIHWIVWNKTNELTIGKMTPLTFYITDQTKAPWDWDLEERIRITYNSHEMDISPSSFWNIVDGKKTVFIEAKTPGYASITIKHWDTELGSEVVLIK